MSIRTRYSCRGLRRPCPVGIIPDKPRKWILGGGENRFKDLAFALRSRMNRQAADSFLQAKYLTERLKYIFIIARTEAWERETCLDALHETINRFPVLRQQAYQHAVNNYITVEAERVCSIHLTRAELNRLWIEIR